MKTSCYPLIHMNRLKLQPVLDSLLQTRLNLQVRLSFRVLCHQIQTCPVDPILKLLHSGMTTRRPHPYRRQF